jgi:uncharacterized protein
MAAASTDEREDAMAEEKKIEGMEPRFCEKVDLSEAYFMRFQPGDDLVEKIKEFCKTNGMERAAILSGIGSVCDVKYADPKSSVKLPLNREKDLIILEEEGPFELQTLEGNVVPLHGEFANMKHGDLVPHLHVTLGARFGQISGGHLISAKVFTTVEIFIAKVKGSKVRKKQSSVTSLAEMRTDLE